jgi:hypothetical protein
MLRRSAIASEQAAFYSICHDIQGSAMSPIRLRIPREEAADFSDDLTAWASVSGIDPRLTIDTEPGKTTNLSSPILYLVYVNESFFDQFPEWRTYIEQ